MNERLSISELNGEVKKVLSASFTTPLWVMGEISEINVNASGHCYLTLIEKGGPEERIVAQVRATIWSYTFRMLRPFFETSTGQQLTEGIKVLLQVSVEFHELYGYSLNVRNIDPSYTLGDQARKRREIILRLTEEGVINMNKELELPLVPQKIAIISSSTAAGYQDFMEQLTGNPAGYQFYTKLFPAIMQGHQAENSITDALDRIYPYEEFFDLVVIIRGGGSQVDLSCFDNYQVAYHVTQFPIPVLTGIGHEKDDSIVDMVAHTRLKTPTAVAEFILNGVSAFEEQINLLKEEAIQMVEQRMGEERSQLEELAGDISALVRHRLTNSRNELMQQTWKFQQEIRLNLRGKDHALSRKIQTLGFFTDRYIFVRKQGMVQMLNRLSTSLPRLLSGERRLLDLYPEKFRKLYRKKLETEYHRMEIARQKGELTDPAIILKKGYSITTSGGRLVRDLSQMKNADTIKTQFYNGSIVSKVLEINKTEINDN